MPDLPTLDLSTLAAAARDAVAIRANLRLQPAGGPGTKVFPPTYVADDNRNHGNTRYAFERRRIDGEEVPCVLLDSVASQANRMELALQEGWDAGELEFPLVQVDFAAADEDLEAPIGRVTALQAPHRIYDAILRDSVDADGVLFRYTPAGQRVTQATVRDATSLYHYCPTALVFGAWDITGPKGGLGSKFQRTITSEIVAIGAQAGTKVGGRLDPLGIVKKAGPLREVGGRDGWAFEAPKGKKDSLNPSDVNHGNVAPSRDDEAGGITFDYARQTIVLSLPALRRLRFPQGIDGTELADRKQAEAAARTALAALALAGVVGAHAEGHDLRSGALLVGKGPLAFEIVGSDGTVSGTYTLDAEAASELLSVAAEQAAAAGLPWTREPLAALRPAEKLVKLLAKSQSLEAKEALQAEEG